MRTARKVPIVRSSCAVSGWVTPDVLATVVTPRESCPRFRTRSAWMICRAPRHSKPTRLRVQTVLDYNG